VNRHHKPLLTILG